MTQPIPSRFRLEDGNESICGACRRSGTLICCEHCPAAFHPECAGYSNIDSVPLEDWFCFLCSRKLGLPFELGEEFQNDVGQSAMVMCDSHGEVFQKGLILEKTATHITIKRKERIERFLLTDRRLWRGTLDDLSWTMTPENEYRPNSRAFEIDYQQLAENAMEDAPIVATTHKRYRDILISKKMESTEKHLITLLEHFWSVHLGIDKIPWPSFGYLVSLTDLWENVLGHGGFHSVCQRDLWGAVCKEMIPSDEWYNFTPIAKQTFRSVLLDAETYGGLGALETLYAYVPSPEAEQTIVRDEILLDKSTQRKRRRRRSANKQRGLPPVEEWIPQAPGLSTRNEVLTSAEVDITQIWPHVFTASRAVQEYRSAIGLVNLTNKTKSLRIGDKVDVRLYKDSSLGPWRGAKILAVATASAMEGYRRFHVEFRKAKDTERFPSISDEWVTLLARPSAWGTTLPQPSVLLRQSFKPYFPSTTLSTTTSFSAGSRVEAWLHNGWWPATLVDTHDNRALLHGDVIPLGEGLTWISDFNYIRGATQDETEGYGMIESLKLDEQLYPEEMERKLNVTVDKTIDGHMILSFKRLDQIPSKSFCK